MKTLIITGTYTSVRNGGVNYSVRLYGQTPEQPLCICFACVDINCKEYATLVDHCVKRYAKYFNTDDFNIITISDLSESKRDIKL